MPLHPQAQAFLDIVNHTERTPLRTLSAAAAREVYNQRPAELAPAWIDVHAVDDKTFSSNGLNIPIRIYTPKHSLEPLPVFIFYHGGGMVIGNIEGYDTLCRQLCMQSSCIVISVGYRLAPEHKFPAAIDDAYAAFLWVAQQASTFNGDKHRIAIGGDSAGGNLAAVVTLLAKAHPEHTIQYQVLIYPATAPYADSESHINYAQGYFLERETVLWFHRSYLRSDKDRQDYRYAPLIAEDLSDLPPALVIIAKYDTLRDEGEAYANRLMNSGVETQLIEYEGMFHPFISLAGVLDDGKAAITEIANALRQQLSINDA
ncbi:alpha/beta hydrolase [Eionea flava]